MSDRKPLFWDWVREEAQKVKSDGCTKAIDFRKDCCYLHDLAYWHAKDPWDAYRHYLNGEENYWALAKDITRAEADALIRKCYQDKSLVDGFSLLAWTRWAGTRLGGWWAWRTHRRRERNNG